MIFIYCHACKIEIKPKDDEGCFHVYADHDTATNHGEDGECVSCPVPVQCGPLTYYVVKDASDQLLEALKYIVSKEPIDGSKEYACTYCDMGGAGYSSKGDGHHDDLRDVCPVLKVREAIEKYEGK